MALSKIQSNSYEDTAVHGQRNLIINGAMQVAQRGTSGTSGNGYNSVDRFRIASGSTDEWALTQTQETDAPTGFSRSTKYTCTTAETALASDEWAAIQYTFEGQDLQHLSYGSASAQSVTLSFWVKSSATGTFGVSIYQPNDGRIIGSTYTIASANTWEQKIITFAGDTTGIIDNVNTEGLRIYWFLAAGSSFTSTDNTSWKAYAGTDFAYGHAVNLIDSTSDNFYLTGVQLELGETATTFEHRSYADEFARCQRYFERIQTDGAGTPIGYCSVRTGSWYGGVPFLIEKRSAPSVTLNGSLFLAGIYGDISSQTPTGINEISKRGCRPYKTSGSYTAQGSFIAFQTPASHYIDADAEL